jgi:mannose-1-phosphate guanylyltransferase
MSNAQQEARDKREQSTTNAINKLINNTSTRFGYIKRAMDSLPEAQKYDVEALLEKARSDVEHVAKNRVDASAAKTIANKLTVKHIIEYIIHIKQQERRQ